MKKVVAAIVIIIIVVAGGYMIFHKSDTDNSSTKSSKSSSNSSKTNTPAVNNAVLVTKTDATLGQYLADPSGKALYTYSADSKGVSNCTGACLANWPAYVDTASTTGLPVGVDVIKRTDNGQMQYTYNGQPLYYFASDANGKVTGDGLENFKVAHPAAASSSTTSQPSNSTSTNTSSSGYPY